MVTQLVPRVDLDVAAGEKDQTPSAPRAREEDAASGSRDGRPDADPLTAARHAWFAHLHGYEYEPPFAR